MNPPRTRRRVGLWLVGAFGGVGTTITLGLSALARGLTSTTGLVSALPVFDGLDLVDPGLVSLPRWRPDPGDEPDQVTDAEVSVYGGVARKR